MTRYEIWLHIKAPLKKFQWRFQTLNKVNQSLILDALSDYGQPALNACMKADTSKKLSTPSSVRSAGHAGAVAPWNTRYPGSLITALVETLVTSHVYAPSDSGSMEFTFVSGVSYQFSGEARSGISTASTITLGNNIAVVPFPPAGIAGLGLLGCLAVKRRLRS